MANQVEGKVFKVIEETGTSKAGKEWKKQTVVIETEGQYPKKIAVTFMGEKVIPVAAGLKEGESIVLHINIESNSTDGQRWYNNISGWKIDKVGITNNVTPTEPTKSGEGDDLPF